MSFGYVCICQTPSLVRGAAVTGSMTQHSLAPDLGGVVWVCGESSYCQQGFADPRVSHD